MTEKVDFDKYTENYNQLLHEGTRFFADDESYFAHYKVERVKERLGSEVGRILEYGCGIGRNISFLQAAYPQAEVMGTDIGEASLAIASQANPNARFELERSDLEIGRFDLIFVAGVFHHIPPPERDAACRLLASRLMPGGSLCVFEHNPFNPVTRRIVNTCAYDADAVLLRPAELRGALQRAGLQVVGTDYCLFVPPKLKRLVSIERVLTWLPLGGQYWIRAGHPCAS